MNPDVTIVSFSKRFSRNEFCSGVDEMDEWLKTQASQHERTGNARTFLAIVDGDRVAGYYTLTAYRLELDEAELAFGAGRRRYAVPAVLLARLAVDAGWQGRGLGSVLLSHAFRQVADVSHRVGIEIMVVQAIDDTAATFYEYAGFSTFQDVPRSLYISIRDLLATLRTS